MFWQTWIERYSDDSQYLQFVQTPSKFENWHSSNLFYARDTHSQKAFGTLSENVDLWSSGKFVYDSLFELNLLELF